MLKNLRGEANTIALAVTLAVLTLGHIQYERGEWGPNGRKAVKNCVGTHTNGNCAHMKLNPTELDQADSSIIFLPIIN